ncbi:MAG: outer membrane protein assembly factor BamB [Burkholderiales bacterium]|nr:outer membrane protein assembly factor BamB [Burkholderiales bacterium]
MNVNRLSPTATAFRRCRIAAMALALFGLSGCAWLGIGSSDKKPVVLAPLASNDAAIIWSASTGKAGGALFVPGFGDRIIYAAGRDGTIHALAEEGGRTVSRLEAKVSIAGGVGVADDMVIVGGSKGEVIALDASGRPLWKTPVAGDLLAVPVVASGNVIVRTADGRLLALNRIDGKRKWVFQRSAPALTLRTNAGVLVNRGVIYAGYPGGKIIAIELDSGKPIWEATLSLPRGSTELERIADVAGLPVLDDTRICAAVYQGRTGCVETLNGNVLWSREVSSADGVAIDARHVYVADVDGNVFALDKTSGATVWKQDKLQRRDPGTPVLVRGKVVIGDRDGVIHVLSTENGELSGRIPTDGSRVMALLRSGDRAIAQTIKGGVFAISIR